MFLRFFVITAITAFIIFLVLPLQKNNVCKTFEDYYTNRDKNENCYFNPDIDLTVPEIIKRNGYKVETHHVITEDGYITTIYRIPHSKQSIDRKPRQPVFLQHGLFVNSAQFVIIGNKSLAFVLSEAGYDVWIGNSRGTLYSTKHTTFSSYDDKYWNFSFHELGYYDLPVQIDYIYTITQQKISYIGISLGTTISYVYATTRADMAKEQVKVIISLAPVVYLKNVKLAKFLYPIWPIFQMLSKITHGRLLFKAPYLVKLICLPYPFQIRVCTALVDYFIGSDFEQDDPETMAITLMHNYDYFSAKLANHISQLYATDVFTYYDYSETENVFKYGSSVPPIYNMSEIQVPVYFIFGNNDLIATKENVQRLYSSVPKKYNPYDLYEVKYDKFTHDDFVTARDVVQLLYEHIVDFLKAL